MSPRRPIRLRTALPALVRAAVPAARRLLPALFIAALILSVAASALARPGGGSTFGGSSGGSRSGGSSGGSSSSGGDGDCFWIIDLVLFLVELTVDHPVIGIPLDIAIVGFIAWAIASKQKASAQKDWSTKASAVAVKAAMPSRAVRRQLFTTIAQTDPEFSLVLFEDFAYALYSAVHVARGGHTIATLSPYLGADLLERLPAAAGGLAEVRAVVVGAMRYLRVEPFRFQGRIAVTLELETNYTEVLRSGGEQAYYAVERWTLSRARTARSRAPGAARVIGCPNCGAPLEAVRGNTCSHCKQEINPGDFDWMVDAIVEVEKTPRPPQLTGDTPETGTALATVVDPEAQTLLQALSRKDPTFSWSHLTSRVALVFAEMQVAWSTLEWPRARPFVSDQLFQMLSYWMDTYRRADMRNVTENGRITRIEVAAVMSDRYYDAITLRVFATSLDYTITDAGKVVSGSRSRERAYSEYWTLLRGTGVKTRELQDRACPNCGAPLDINMTGNCKSCRAKVSSGQFDWVLSRIEQDEAYG